MAFRFFGLLALLWGGFYGVWRALPYVRPGAVIVTAAKRRALPFPADVPQSRRVVIFGNSKVLTGFLPEEFDAALGDGYYSWNGGLPGETHFLEEIERMILAGRVPGHVLLTIAPFDPEPSDERLIESWFPFRRLPRDLVLFGVQAPSHGGFRSFYQFGADSARLVAAQRGYYFMASHSRYAGHRLPPNLLLPSDHPLVVNEERGGFLQTREFARWRELSRQYGFRVYLAPRYYRLNEFAAPEARQSQGMAALGPDYFRFENSYFSDPVHLNPEGARLYSRKLAELFRGI